MKVLLSAPVDKLGETGEIVEVATGYARNYLFPQRLAVEPTEHNVKRLEKARLARETELSNREQQARAFREKIEGASFTFKRTAQEEGKLYGSVRLEDITAAIAEKYGYEVERDRIKLGGPIEEIGTVTVHINIYKDIGTDITVVVEAEGVEAAPAKAAGVGDSETPAPEEPPAAAPVPVHEAETGTSFEEEYAEEGDSLTS